MISHTSNKNFKYLQERYTRQRNNYLQNKSHLIKPFIPSKKMQTNDLSAPISNKNLQSRDKLKTLAEKVSTPLLQITTIPYLKVFPITLTIDLKKITINSTNFYKSHSIETLAFEYLKEVTVETGLLSSSIKFVLSGQTQHPIILPHFHRDDAIKAKQIILGLLNCQKEQIKVMELDPHQDLPKIIAVGAAAAP